ncbi:hypothetical protein REPUB_Repub02eG0218100 [Reevesia pubescens]
MINWEALEPAIYPSKHFDIKGAWSGSTTIHPRILYIGVDPKDRQIQNYAVPVNLSDPYLRKWIKPGNNPVVYPEEGVNASAFRDPTTAWWLNGHWRMLIGSKRNHRGIAYLYRSRDFINWIKAKHPLHSTPHTGMWECPDFYPVLLFGKEGLDTSVLGKHVKHVLKADVDVTFYIPSLDKVEPFNPNWKNAHELCAKKGSKVEGVVGPFGLLTLTSKNLEEYTPVFFRVFKTSKKHVVLLCCDGRSSSLKDGLYKPSFAGFVDLDLVDKKLSLRSLIDNYVVESFGGGGKTCITSRVYPTLVVLDNAQLYAFNHGTETIIVENLNAWSMKKPRLMN